MTDTSNHKLIDCWFPCAAVDAAVGTPLGSGRSEKAIFTWFASRPIAQARAAVLAALLPDDPEVRRDVRNAVLGDTKSIELLTMRIRDLYPMGRPVVLDLFSGRGIIPLEAARFGATAIGTDLSPVATLAGRLLGEYPLRDWNAEPEIPFQAAQLSGEDDEEQIDIDCATPSQKARLVKDVELVLAEIGRRFTTAVARYYPRTGDRFPWGYLWAITIPCDGCRIRFPLVGSLVLRHPYRKAYANTTRTIDDGGQSFRVATRSGAWYVEVFDGVPDQLPTFRSAPGKKGKSAHCPFCRYVHSLDAVKAKGAAGEYQDALLVVADVAGATNKVFRVPRANEIAALDAIDLNGLPLLGGLPAVPDEPIPPGNEDTIRASGYGYRSFGSLMCARQTLQFVEITRAIRSCFYDLVAAGVSRDYAVALAAYGCANLVRCLKHATRGAKLRCHGKPDGSEQNRVQIDHIYSDESKVAFGFDFFEAGPGTGPGTFASLAVTGLTPLLRHTYSASGQPGRFRRASAIALPLRDGTVDAVVTDPPYYNMIDYADASDLFYVWLKRGLSDILPELFNREDVTQDKTEEIIVKRGGLEDEHRTRDFYEASLSKAFDEARRVLRPDGHLVVVFGHADPDAWRRLLSALNQAAFVVTSSWPSRTETANTGVASIKVTVAIGCRVAAPDRPVATASQVEREIAATVRERVKDWARDGLALPDQMMAAYGPAMEVYGRYGSVLMPDGSAAPLEQYLMLARRAVRDAMALKLEQIPLETFDVVTAFAVFWMRAFGRTAVPKGEAKFMAQASNLRIEDVRSLVLTEASSGYRLELGDPGPVSSATPVFNLVRAMAVAWQREGSEGVASTIVVAERSPDDQHVWAVVGDLAAQLPSSDTVAKALAAIQRNRSTIQSLARGISQRRASDENQLQLTDV